MPNWKKVIVSGSNAVLNQITASGIISASGALISSELTASGLRYPSTDGTDGQVLITDGSGILTFNDNITYVTVNNNESGTLTKGTPVHATGTSGNTPLVVAASASVSTKMPATFVLAQDLASGAEGRAVLSGFLNGVNTNGFTEGDVLYVAPDGGYSPNKPSGSNLIQNIALVGKADTNGSIYVYGSGRSNDVPNLLDNQIFFGSGSNQTQQIHISGALDSTIINNITASGNISGSSISTASFGTYIGDGSQLTNLPSPFPITASEAQIISRSIASGDTDSTALRLLGSGSVSQSGIFEVEGSAGPLFSVADGLDGVLMEVNNISGLPLFQVSSSNEVFINRGNLTSGVTTATASFAYFTGSFAGDGGGLTNLNVTTAQTASYVETAQTASYVTLAQTASYVETAQTASYVTLAQTASYVTTAQTASYVTLAQTASFALTSSLVIQQDSVDKVVNTRNINFTGNAVALTTGAPNPGASVIVAINTGSAAEAFPFTGDAQITGSLIVSGSGGLSVESSGSTVFEVIGSEGTLFSIDDDLDGVIFTANDRSGLPVLEASASGEVYIGKAPQSLYTTAVISSTTAATTQSIYGLSTSSYGGAFFDYTVQSGSDARAGSIMSVWNGSSLNFTETTTTDIGDTTDFNVIVHISESQAQIASHATRAGYNIKTIIRSI